MRQKKEKSEKRQKKTPVLIEVLRYLSVFAALMVLFPLLLATETYFQAITDTKVICLRFLLIEVCGFIGFFISMLLSAMRSKWNLPAPMINMICILLCAVPVLLVFGCCGANFESYRTLCMMVYAAVAYFMGTVFYYRSYGTINTKVTLAWLCGLHFLVIAVLLLVSFTYTHNIVAADMPLDDTVKLSAVQIALMDLEATARVLSDGFQYDLSLFVPEFLIYISIFGLVQNQSHIDYLMERRKHKMEDLPKWVRTYNMWLTSAIMAVIAVLFLCKDWIIKGIKWIAATVGFALVKAMGWFGSLFVHEKFEDYYVEESAETVEDFIVAAAEGSQRATMYFSYFLVIMIFVVLIWVMIRFRVFQKLWRFLKTAGSSLLRQFRDGNKGRERTQLLDQEYTDSETELDADARKNKKKENSSAYKQWRQKYKQFLKIKGTDRRYEQGFLLLADYFKLRGVPLIDGDTAAQINAKVIKSKKIDSNVGDHITEGYHLLCYAEKDCTAEKMNILEQALHKAYTDSKSLKVVEV